MDEKIIKLFADVGPHAEQALNSYISLQWAKFIMLYGMLFFVILLSFILIYCVLKYSPNLEE